MRWIAWGVGAVAVVMVAVWLVGGLLPVEHTATVRRVVAAEPARTWSVITDVQGSSRWRSGIDSVERLPDRNGRPVWREHGADGALTFEVVEWSPPWRMVTRIVDEGLPFGGTWTYELAAADRGTRVTLREDGEVYDRFFRFMSRFIIGHEATMETYLDGLEARMAGGEGEG